MFYFTNFNKYIYSSWCIMTYMIGMVFVIRLRDCILRRSNSEAVINLLSNRRRRLREPYLSYQLGTVVSVQDLLRSSLPLTLSLSVPRRTSPRVCVVGGGGVLFEKGVSLGWWWQGGGGRGVRGRMLPPLRQLHYIRLYTGAILK